MLALFAKRPRRGMRVGFMVAPETVINEAVAIHKLIDRQGEQLLEEAMTEARKLGLQISDGSNYFFQPNIQEADRHVRIGY